MSDFEKTIMPHMRACSDEQGLRLYSQGARCGHIEGKDRVGVYVMGEEIEAANIATEAQGIQYNKGGSAWWHGYCHGYLLAVEGSALEKEHQERELPE